MKYKIFVVFFTFLFAKNLYSFDNQEEFFLAFSKMMLPQVEVSQEDRGLLPLNRVQLYGPKLKEVYHFNQLLIDLRDADNEVMHLIKRVSWYCLAVDYVLFYFPPLVQTSVKCAILPSEPPS